MIDRRILTLSVGFGVGIWVLDAALDALFFYERPFLSLFLTDVPPHELYVRTIILLSFVLFGVVLSWQTTRLEKRDREAGLFRTLLDEATDSIFVIDPESGTFIDVNDTACEKLDYDRSFLLEMGVSDISAEFDTPADFQRFSHTEGQTLETYESTHVRADGTAFPVEVSALNVTIDDRTHRIAITRDITERKERQREIQASRKRYESLFTSIRDAILIADTDRQIIDCNPAFIDLFGYSLEEIKGKPSAILYEDEAEFESLGAEIRHGPDDPQFSKTITYETKSGQTFPGETNVSVLRNVDDDVIGFIGLIRDISERHERLRQIKMIDRVLRHNLHNDMNVILGRAEQIQTVSSGEPARDAETIAERGQQLLETTDKEREVTKFLADKSTPTPHNVTRLITTTVEEIRNRHPDAEIALEVPDEQVVVVVDHFEKAIEELLENAILHSDRDVPSITVTLTCDDEMAQIRIADDGPGIPEMEQRVLIEGEEIQPLYHGRGFGLWLVNLMVEHSRGTLTIEENEPRGTIVTVRLLAG